MRIDTDGKLSRMITKKALNLRERVPIRAYGVHSPQQGLQLGGYWTGQA
jgi:hypothetical protein